MFRVSEALKRDHREVEDAYFNIVNATDNEEKTRWQQTFSWGLASHSIGEELVVYPAMEEYVPNGKEMADKDRKEHQEVKKLLSKFCSLKASDADFLPTINTLWSNLSEHIKDEEQHDLILLEKAIDESVSMQLLDGFNRAKMFDPSHNHSNAPNKAPFKNVADLLAAPNGRLKDIFDKFPIEDKRRRDSVLSGQHHTVR